MNQALPQRGRRGYSATGGTPLRRSIGRWLLLSTLLVLVLSVATLAKGNLPPSSAGSRSSFSHSALASATGAASYDLVAADGGVFTYGGGAYYGSTGNIKLNAPIVGMASTPDGKGYWLVASDGGIFSFGDAQFYGSTGAMTLNKPIVGMASTPDGLGYYLVASDGGIFSFGDASYLGSEGAATIPGSIVTISVTNTQALSAPGSTGYDVSNFQCAQLPPQAPLYVMEVVGWPFTVTSSATCLSHEFAWGGPQTQLYIFMGDTVPPPPNETAPPCPSGLDTLECTGWQNGYTQALFAYQTAQNAQVNSSIWWLDVETAAGAWTSNQAENYQAVLGARAALTAQGKIVGVYSTSLQWPQIAGASASLVGVPLWATDWNTGNAALACGQAQTYGGGTLLQVQIKVPGSTFDDDVAC